MTLKNPQLTGSDFSFEIDAPDLASCEVQTATTPFGSWTSMAVNPPARFVVRVDKDRALFRVRSGSMFSSDTVGYTVRIFPRYWSFVANPFDRQQVTIADLFPNPPPRTQFFKFDAVRQTWSAAAQFQFGAWTHPNETLAPTEGAVLYTPTPFREVFYGFVPTHQTLSLQGGWNLVSLSFVTALPAAVTGDTIAVYYPSSQVILISMYSGFDWNEWPEIVTGEESSFWYKRNTANSSALPSHGVIYFNNYGSPFGNRPVIDEPGTREPLAGREWMAQLFGGPEGTAQSALIPWGEPLFFLTGEGAGYVDTSPGALRMTQGVSGGGHVMLELRYWTAASGSTWQEAIQNSTAMAGRSHLGTRNVGATGSTPPSMPFQWPNEFVVVGTGNAQPMRLVVFEGQRARFAARRWPGPAESYRWQKQVDATTWIDVPGATSFELVFNNARLEDSGVYRLVETPGFEGEPVTLRVLSNPQFGAFNANQPGGVFTFTITADPGGVYQLQASDNLTNWLYVAEMKKSGEVIDRLAGSFPNRFYRLMISE